MFNLGLGGVKVIDYSTKLRGEGSGLVPFQPGGAERARLLIDNKNVMPGGRGKIPKSHQPSKLLF